ncbi:RING/U-box protein with DUF 1232 [Prunus dulcis]|uniref:RING/U-box protein with DUF 1232 n=1 Tax=Prunus dulcis TaxID=3755 RepID=A0A4Y1QW02_PRUDU|nr:RING/U-box protein with DUF 1232 [Prunus dulcis]
MREVAGFNTQESEKEGERSEWTILQAAICARSAMATSTLLVKPIVLTGNCIMLVWHHGSALQPCKCPLCRRYITLLVPSEASLRQADRPEVAEILRKVERYNRYFGDHPRSLIQRGQDLPFFLRRLLRELIDPNRSLPARRMAQICFAVKNLHFSLDIGTYNEKVNTMQ